MASGPGRGAQVRLRGEHQRYARGGGTGRLLDNILGKRREEEEGRGAAGLNEDGSFPFGPEALDEVLTPGGRATGFGGGGEPGFPAVIGGFAAASGFGGAPGIGPGDILPVAGSFYSAFSFGGTVRATAAVAGTFAATTAFAGTLTGTVALGGGFIARSTYGAAVTAQGRIAGGFAAASTFGSGLAGGFTARAAFSGSVTGTGASLGGFAATSFFGATLRGLAQVSGSWQSAAAFAGTVTGVTGIPVTETTITDRSGEPFTLRDGTALEARTLILADLTDRTGAVFTLRDGSTLQTRIVPADPITDRAGVPFTLRDGSALEARLLPDPVEPPPVVVPPDPTPEPVVFPTGPHLRFDTEGTGNWAAAVVLRQDGIKVDLRLVRPLYSNTAYAAIDAYNTTAFPTNLYFGGQPDWIRDTNGQLYISRSLTSADDGTYAFALYRNMSDDTFLTVDVVLTVAADATTVNPQPTPVPTTPQVFVENFDAGRGVGSFIHFWQKHRLITTPQGTMLLDGSDKTQNEDGSFSIPGCALMTPPNAANQRTTLDGFPEGRFEFSVKFYGDNIGDGPGPAVILWPADDVWPGQEYDLGELGTRSDALSPLYMARHWRTAEGGNGQDIWAVADQPARFPQFDHRVWHVNALDHIGSKVTFYVDGKVLFSADTDIERDALHGGVNHTAGLANASSQTKLECGYFRFTPAALVVSPHADHTPPAAGVGPP